MKMAIIIPLLKKILLDYQIFKNYRPVSNLSFISKVAEKAVDFRTTAHTRENNLEEPLQSAYKQSHSTETALLKVHNDILRGIDEQKVCMLVLLDLSAAFDTVDHEILLSRLENRFGITGTALAWYKSYLSGRSQQVSVNGVLSEPQTLMYGVPQGSILGPQKFVKYTVPLGEIIRKHGLAYHFYADDTQLYIIFDVKNTAESIKKVELCVAEIRDWMKANYLKFNDGKTELIILGTVHQLAKLDPTCVHIGDSNIVPTESARNIGVMFDRHMSMEKQVNAMCQVANYHIRNIRNVRGLLTTDACKKLVHALVTSRLDFGNSLLGGIAKYLVKKIQRVQNSAARLVAEINKFDHLTSVLKDLHWLPVEKRINFKILLITYKALNGLAPTYLRDLLQFHNPPRSLRSGGQLRLKVPATKLKTYGDRAFSVLAPKLWNKLPLEIRLSESVDIFKSKLKTHFLSNACN